MFDFFRRRRNPAHPIRGRRPSEEGSEAERLREFNNHNGHPDDYVSDDYCDSSSRGGPLGTGDEMPEGGDSTRGISKGPASKSPFPTDQSA